MSGELPEELPAGFEFGPYLIHGCIGRGGMARVYRAEQAALHRSVALKVLDRWALEEASGRERFVREARAAASIKHPNVVDILDVGVWQERPYIVMELLVGRDLASYLDEYGVLTETEIARIALPVIAGMMAVHDAGVVHRDVKPSNIFLADGPEGEIIPKVLDFGVSKFSNSLNDPLKRATKTREIVGTPAYMAPEALNGVRELGPAADQYALGAVLYECAVGRPPFDGETLLELLMAVASGKIERPSSLRHDISSVLERSILRAISGEPRARFETLRDMGRALWPLADARTQAIWELSFGNGQVPSSRRDPAATLLRIPEELPQFAGRLRRWGVSLRRSWRRPAALLAASGALLGVGAVIYAAVRSPEVPGAASPTAAASATTLAATSTAPAQTPATPVATQASGSVEQAAQGRATTTTERAVSALRTSREASRPRREATARTPARASRRSRNERTTIPPVVETPAAEAPVASRPASEPTREDNELEGLFTEPRQGQPAPGVDPELDGLFATTKPGTRGANGAPFPE